MSLFAKKKKEEPQNIDEVLTQFKELKSDFQKIVAELETLKKANQTNVQKIGVVRFNPFEGLGGNQSFTVAILDGNNSGAVITSLFTREGNRVYGKPIKEGLSEFKLTNEETKAIALAQKDNNHQTV